MRSQVTTKSGDEGESTALDGERYPKSHPIMECVGTLDELWAHTALLRLRILDEKPAGSDELGAFLLWLLRVYFVMGSTCSDPARKHPEYHPREVEPRDLERLEAEQQRLEACTPLPHSFILSPANTLAAQADIACTVARRLERAYWRLCETEHVQASNTLPAFLNRLSDYLYILARHLDGGQHVTVDSQPLD